MAPYGMRTETTLSFDEAVAKVTAELQKEGFGVLTTIDVQQTLRKKLNVDYPRYVILGACNPPFAYKALQVDDQIGLLLPCNIVVQEREGKTTVSAFDPLSMGKIMENPDVVPIADEVKKRLERVLANV